MAGNSDESQAVRGILCIGEYGRIVDLSAKKPMVDLVLKGFNSNNSGVKQASSIAFGNIIVGNPNNFLKELFTMIKAAKGA